MKIKLLMINIIIMMYIFVLPAAAQELSPEEIIPRLYEESGADELYGGLTDEADGFLDDIGFSGFLPDGVDDISPESVLSGISNTLRENLAAPLRALSCIIGIIAVAAAFDAVKTSGASDEVLTLVTGLCAVSVAAPPLLDLTNDLCNAVDASGRFMLIYVPVISGLTIAGGRESSGAAYCAAMIYVINAVTQAVSRIVVPLIKCVTAMSVISSAGEGARLSGVTELFRKAARFVLTFCMSLFAAFLTMRTIVAAAADSLTNRAVKFAVSSFVPLVGGALSDAYQTVLSCVGVLRAGVGAAAIAAVFAIFIPAAVRCAVWLSVTAFSAAVCDLFGVSRVSSLLRGLSGAVSVMLAVLMCVMVMYIISTAILLIAAR